MSGLEHEVLAWQHGTQAEANVLFEYLVHVQQISWQRPSSCVEVGLQTRQEQVAKGQNGSVSIIVRTAQDLLYCLCTNGDAAHVRQSSDQGAKTCPASFGQPRRAHQEF